MVATGTAYARTDNYFVDGAFDRGWQMAGCIIEIWQKGKVVKHWSNIPGNGGKTRLTNDVKQLRINAKGQECNGEYSVFDNATEICPVSQKGEKIDLDEVLSEYRELNKPEAGTGVPAGKPAEKATNPSDFVIESFCGYKFGSPRPEFDQRIVKMQKPFRHYDYLRPSYGTVSGKLVAVRLESRQAFAGAAQRGEALLGVVAVLEKKYGIELKAEGSGDYYYFNNGRMHLWLNSNCIEVRRLDLQRMEEQQSRSARDEIKKNMPATAADDGADVL